ncbi:MAG TPA: 3-hydroxyacyl-CoA dehydrogenase NAD-binding domain-containing protein [Frankiaceae bacterium]|nr:3-hydroxyacyl-CoA dehydrogenase NAD-binding domain-containing protein [Frankiaceae bacterium]
MSHPLATPSVPSDDLFDRTQSPVRYERGDDDIVVLTLDDPSASANTLNAAYVEAMDAAIDRLEAESAELAGVIVTSAKKTFFAGANLDDLMKATKADAQALYDESTRVKAQLRRLEKLGKPVVAAINGAAMGGGLEITLACHHRIIADVPGAKVGLPEVKLGLLPGGGGVARVTRMLGIADGVMKVLGQGTEFRPQKAKDAGLVHEVVGSIEELVPAAKAWIAANPTAVQPWDVKGYKIPGGTPSTPALAQMLPAFPANLRKQLKGAPMPAPHHILCAAVEGAAVDIDTAFDIESRYFVDLATGQVAKNMTQAFFFDLQAINSGASRPNGQPKWTATKAAVLGAGMMGAGIAYSLAKVGVDVVLKDVSVEAAEKGKAYSQKLLEKAVARGRSTQEKADALLARITPTAEYSDLTGCDLVIEAVFEDPSLKKSVFAEAQKYVNADALLCSNTSTLPITDLATGVSRRDDFVGLHFFSPVDKMPLVEIVRGGETGDAALAKAFDVVRQIQKTPIVVADSRGFFTSRVIGTMITEALALLAEGLHPASVEQAGSQAGYPAPPLQLLDELTLTLPRKIREETRTAIEAAGGTFPDHPGNAVLDRMVEEFGRLGRSSGAGFYDYVDGKRTKLWPGLVEHFGSSPTAVPFRDAQERMLFAEALETVKCFDEGILTTSADANIGSIFGIGFPAWTGGVRQYIEQYDGGVAGFVARADELAAAYGERFTPPASLRQQAESKLAA